jgi:peptide/nickel transport system permease protein
MGYLSFAIKKVISYFLALFGTMAILFVGTYPIYTTVIVNSANFVAAQALRTLEQRSHTPLTPEQIQQIHDQIVNQIIASYGLNKPFAVQFFYFLKNLLTFNLGYGYTNAPITSNTGSYAVADIIASYLPNTILLFTTGTIIVIILGLVIGLLAARYAGSVWDRLVPVVAVVHSSFPTWWIGFLLIAALAYGVHLFPPGGIVSVPPPKNPVLYALDVLYHMALPLISIIIVGVGGFAYVVRSLVLSTLSEDFVIALRARAIPERIVLFKHVMRASSPSIVTQVLLALTTSITGSLTTEVVFQWPGMGLLTWNAIIENDVPVMLGVLYVTTLVLLAGLLLGELIYGVLDPRIRVGED